MNILTTQTSKTSAKLLISTTLVYKKCSRYVSYIPGSLIQSQRLTRNLSHWESKQNFRKYLSTVNEQEINENRVPATLHKPTNFEQMELLPKTLEGIKKLLGSDALPNTLQQFAITRIRRLGPPYVLIGAKDGTGKTATYLIPLIDKLAFEKFSSTDESKVAKPHRPEIIIVVPSRFLVTKVYNDTLTLCSLHNLQVRTLIEKQFQGDEKFKGQVKENDTYDVLITTPMALLQEVLNNTPTTSKVLFSQTKTLVLDDVDGFYDSETFTPDIHEIIGIFKQANKVEHRKGTIFFVVSPVAKTFKNRLGKAYSGLRQYATNDIFKKDSSAPFRYYDDNVGTEASWIDLGKLEHTFVDCSADQPKNKQLLQVVRQHLVNWSMTKTCQKMVIFQSSKHGARLSYEWFVDNDYASKVATLTGNSKSRIEALEKFSDPNSGVDILFTTDILARGIDLNVDHVVLYTTPESPKDYVSKVGRITRNGKQGGHATIFVNRTARRLVENIKRYLKMGTEAPQQIQTEENENV